MLKVIPLLTTTFKLLDIYLYSLEFTILVLVLVKN